MKLKSRNLVIGIVAFMLAVGGFIASAPTARADTIQYNQVLGLAFEGDTFDHHLGSMNEEVYYDEHVRPGTQIIETRPHITSLDASLYTFGTNPEPANMAAGVRWAITSIRYYDSNNHIWAVSTFNPQLSGCEHVNWIDPHNGITNSGTWRFINVGGNGTLIKVGWSTSCISTSTTSGGYYHWTVPDNAGGSGNNRVGVGFMCFNAAGLEGSTDCAQWPNNATDAIAVNMPAV